MKFRIGKTKWEIIHYVVLDVFTVYRNDKKAEKLYMKNDFETEAQAMFAILKEYQVNRFQEKNLTE